MHLIAHRIDLLQSPEDGLQDLQLEGTLPYRRYEPPEYVLDFLLDGLLDVDRLDSETLPQVVENFHLHLHFQWLVLQSPQQVEFVDGDFSLFDGHQLIDDAGSILETEVLGDVADELLDGGAAPEVTVRDDVPNVLDLVPANDVGGHHKPEQFNRSRQDLLVHVALDDLVEDLVLR